MSELLGIGLYTPKEASGLLGIPSGKISRWLRGHSANGKNYEPLWEPEVILDESNWALGFRDLMEIRVASAFISLGISSIQVRNAIILAREVLGQDHPLATNRFRTDGRVILLQVIETDESGNLREKLLNLFNKQYEFKGIIDPILKSVDFDNNGDPSIWWPIGRDKKIVVDPSKSFGQPIDFDSSVPTKVLAAAAELDGINVTAEIYEVSRSAVRHAVEFENNLRLSLAA